MEHDQLLQQMERVLRQRGQAMFGSILDGLQSLVIQAKTGDPQARAVLRQWRAIQRELDALGLDVIQPGEN